MEMIFGPAANQSPKIKGPTTRYLVRQGWVGWMIWDRERKGPAFVSTGQLTNFKSEAQARSALELCLASGALVEPNRDAS
jgi:hypothetical protein